MSRMKWVCRYGFFALLLSVSIGWLVYCQITVSKLEALMTSVSYIDLTYTQPGEALALYQRMLKFEQLRTWAIIITAVIAVLLVALIVFQIVSAKVRKNRALKPKAPKEKKPKPAKKEKAPKAPVSEPVMAVPEAAPVEEPAPVAEPAPMEEPEVPPVPEAQSEPVAVFCTECGKRFDTKPRFCDACGHPFQ